MIELGKRLRSRGHEVFYYCWYHNPHETFDSYKKYKVNQTLFGSLAKSVSRVTRNGSVAPSLAGVALSSFTNVPLMIKSISDIRPDFIYLPVGHTFAGLVAKACRTGLICYYGSFPTILTNDSILTLLLRPFEKHTIRSSIVFVNSHYLGSFIRRRLDVDNLSVLHPGADIRRFSSVRRADEGRTLLYVGRFSVEKWNGHNFLLEITRQLLGKLDAKLVLVGGLREGHEPYLARLGTRIRELNLQNNVQVVVNASDDQVTRIYSSATIYADPNVYDYSIAVVEALAAGLPVVVRNEGGQSEPIVHGETGFRLNSNKEQWVKCIEAMLTRPNMISSMSRKARERAKAFSWDRAAEKLESRIIEHAKK